MAWDAPRHGDPLPRPLGRPVSFLFELDSHKSPIETQEHIEDARPNMCAHPSPIGGERRLPPMCSPMVVRVTAKFHDPAIRFTYDRTYQSSTSFTPTDNICRGFLRRIEHCSNELITRKDSNALNAVQCLQKGPKPVRFEIFFEISRQGHFGVWAQRNFTSYQKHALTGSAAQEVLRSTHSIVGMFLRRHDKAFKWTDEPGRSHFPDKPETFKPSHKGPLELTCVPRSLFLESQQTWEFVPGYSLEFTFNSRNPARHQSEIKRILKVDSEQITPLNLGLGEDLLWQAHKCLQDVLDQKKSSFDLEHMNCDGFDGVPDCDCQHFEDNALDVGLRVVNNLGPVYDHLHRSIQSSLRLFTQPSGEDCDEFVSKVLPRLREFRTRCDKKLERLNDFDFRIAELTGHGWQQKNCARFIIDSHQNHTRRSIQALLDRIRTGVSDVLRGNDVAVRMIAYKRGHLVLDKALIARDHKPAPPIPEPAEYQQHLILAELNRRIQQDIDMVCHDTCVVDEKLQEIPAFEANIFSPRPATSSARPHTPLGTSPHRSQHVRPRASGSFAIQSPTSSALSLRSSSRVFPLVPPKYKEREEWASTRALSARNLENGRSWCGSTRSLNDIVRKEPAVHLEAPSVLPETDHDSDIRVTHTQGLKPAAELYSSSKEEYDTDTSSTHSSMPALTESDTPSPDQSMLFTPVCGRSSPTPRGIMSVDDINSHHFSGSFVTDISAPNSTTFSDLDRFEDPKDRTFGKDKFDHPVTPSRPVFVDPVPVHSLKVPEDTSDDEKTPLPLAHHHIPESPEANGLGYDGNAREISPRNAGETGPESSEHGSISCGIDSAQVVPEHTLNQGWMLYSVQEEEGLDQAADQTHETDGVSASLAECDSSETLRPSTLMHMDSIDRLAGLRVENPNSSVSAVPSDTERITSPAVLVEQEMSESPDVGEVIPFSDSGIFDMSGSEADEKQTLACVDESAPEFRATESNLLDLNSGPAEQEQDTASVPSEDGLLPVVANDLEAADILFDISDASKTQPGPAPKPESASAKLPKVRTSGSDAGSRSISNPQPSPTHLGLGNAHLLPPLPIFSAFRSASHETRASWTTSSSWEDYVSTVRKSSDSVDTFQPSPTGSEAAVPLDSTKRLGTPTAGLLGLNESRWAELGIRTALTGTHAFDDAPTVPESPESCRSVSQSNPELHQTHEAKICARSPSPPTKSAMLRQKKSIGSMLKASRLKRKESKELRKKKSVEMQSLKKTKSKNRESPVDEDGGARFPKAMMLVAGLAFASSVVSRSTS